MSEVFPFGAEPDHPEIPARGNLSPSLGASKVRLHSRAQDIAKLGRYYRLTDDAPYRHEFEKPIPGTPDTVCIISEDTPSTTPGIEGFMMQITYSETIGEPDIDADGQPQYSYQTHAFLFYEIPDGIHMEKHITYSPKKSETDVVSIANMSMGELFEAYDRQKAANSANEDFEREMGVNICIQEDVDAVNQILDRAFGPTPAV